MDATVEADGAEKTVSAHYGDKVSDVIAEAGVVLDDNDAVNVDINGELTNNTDLVVTRYHKVTVHDNGATQIVDVPEGTVANVLSAANITLGERGYFERSRSRAGYRWYGNYRKSCYLRNTNCNRGCSFWNRK